MPFINKHKLRQLRADAALYQNLITPSNVNFEVVAAERIPGDRDFIWVGDAHFHSDTYVGKAVRESALDLLYSLTEGDAGEVFNRIRAEITRLGGVAPDASPVEELASKLGPVDPATPTGFIQKLVGPDDIESDGPAFGPIGSRGEGESL